ncbi:nucleotidyltransferase [Bifidobacterium avesanii]|nr:nucleotidyltransferase [Bifidobacterium avesanii]
MLSYEGDPISASGSPRDMIKGAFQYYDFMDESLWLRMLRDRNDSAHMYDENRAKQLVQTILNDYLPEFERVNRGMIDRYGKMLTV